MKVMLLKPALSTDMGLFDNLTWIAMAVKQNQLLMYLVYVVRNNGNKI